MKIQYTLPKNEPFFRDYAGLTGTLNTLGYLAQIVSALTEFGVIFALVESSLIDFFPQVARPAGIFGAFIGTAFLEVGLRKFLPYSVRALLYKRFSGLHFLITCFVFAVTLGLLGASGYLSFAGSKELVRTTAPPPKLASMDSADIQEQQQRETALLQYQSDSLEVVQRFALPLAAIREKYAAKLQSESQGLNQVETTERTRRIKLTTKKAEIRTRITAIQAQQAEELASLEYSKAKAMEAAVRAKNGYLAKAAKERDEQRQSITERNALAVEQSTNQIRKYGSGLAWFTVFALGVLLFSVSIDEIHKKGAGIEEVVLPTQYYFSQGVFAEALSMLSDKWNYFARTAIQSLAERTPPPREPALVPELWDAPSGLIRRKALTDTTDNTNQAQSLGNHLIPDSRPVIQGFKRNDSTTETTNEIRYQSEPGNGVVIDSALKPCQYCANQFRPKVTWQKYCSDECKLAYHAQKHGKTFNPSRYHKKFKV